MPSQSEQTDEPQRENYFEIVYRLALILALASAIAVAITYSNVLELPGHFEARFFLLLFSKYPASGNYLAAHTLFSLQHFIFDAKDGV